MSTILDSLKKSSNQRNSSDGGSLDNFNFSNDKESSTSFSKVIIILFIALVFAATFWVYQNYFAADVIGSDTDNAVIEQVVKKPLSKPEELETSQNLSKKEKPNSDAIKAQIKQIKDRKELAKREESLSALNRKQAPAAERSEKQDVLDKIKSHRSLVKTDKYKIDEDISKQKPKKIAAIKSSKDLSSTKIPSNPDQQHRLLYQLPFAIRKEVPEIKLNIHVYDKAPENRIAIINGTRFAIDDMITDQVLLKDILINGILLDYDGTEFFVPN